MKTEDMPEDTKEQVNDKPLDWAGDEGDKFKANLDALIEAEIERGYQEGFSAGLRKAAEAVELGRKVAQAIRKGGAR